MSRYIHTVSNRGVSGDSTTQMLARFNADVIATNPEYVIINGGKNDVSAGVSLATIMGNIATMATRARQAGIQPILSTIIPYGNDPTGPTFTAKQQADTVSANHAIRGYSAANGLHLIDFYGAVVDSDGWARPEYMKSDNPAVSDNLHPGRAGKAAMAQCVLEVFDSGSDGAVSYADSLITNGDFSDGLTGWDYTTNKTPGMVLTPTLVPNRWGGNTVKIVASASNTAVDTGSFFRTLNTGWAVGNTIEVECDLMLTDVNTVAADTSFNARVACVPSSIAFSAAYTREDTPHGIMYRYRASGVVPEGTTKIIFLATFLRMQGTAYIARVKARVLA